MEDTKEYRAALKRARRALDQACELAAEMNELGGDERDVWLTRSRRWRLSSDFIKRSLAAMRR